MKPSREFRPPGRPSVPRRRVDFRKLQPAWFRYLLALLVVVPIVILAWASFRDDPIPEARFAPFVPFVGWFVVAVLVLAFGLRLYGAWRDRQRRAAKDDASR